MLRVARLGLRDDVPVVIDAHPGRHLRRRQARQRVRIGDDLNLAEKMRKVHPESKLRFIWIGGEELGPPGSDYYVSHLSPAEPGRISYDLDADVTATPNYLIGVLDPAAPDLFSHTVTTTFPDNVYEPSKIARDLGVDYLNTIGKLPEEVDLFGGTVGNFEGNVGTFDGGCVDNPFRWCDNLTTTIPRS